MKRTHDLHVSEPWFTYIKLGLKTVEGKKKSPTWEKLRKGDYLKITNGKDWFLAEIVNINTYEGSNDNLADYLKKETLERTLPGIDTLEEGIKVYLTEPVSWTKEEIKKYGVMALQLKNI